MALTKVQTGLLEATGTPSATTFLRGDGSWNTSITSGTAVTASGTAINFTDIPATAKRITVMFNGVSTSGTSPIQIQLGSTTFTTSGYSCILGSQVSSITGVVVVTTGFYVVNNLTAATNAYGSIIFSNLASNYWAGQGNFFSRNDSVSNIAGGITLAGTLDRLRITTVNGTDTFDLGTINILIE